MQRGFPLGAARWASWLRGLASAAGCGGARRDEAQRDGVRHDGMGHDGARRGVGAAWGSQRGAARRGGLSGDIESSFSGSNGSVGTLSWLDTLSTISPQWSGVRLSKVCVVGA